MCMCMYTLVGMTVLCIMLRNLPMLGSTSSEKIVHVRMYNVQVKVNIQ